MMKTTRRAHQLLTSVFIIGVITLSFSSRAATKQASTSKLVELTVPAPSLKGNLLGDPTEQPIIVYLPPGYDTSPTKRYPTLYLLHGFSDKSNVWTTGFFQGLSLQPFMDELIRTGKIRELIVVAANGWNSYGGSFYTNSPVTGNWEDFIYQDLVGNIDANYRTIARAESRGIAGTSMGGYGAVLLGMKHPDVFSVLYAMGPCCLALEDALDAANPAWPDVFRLKSRSDLNLTPRTLKEVYTTGIVAFAAAFSPNPERPPFYVDFPYKPKPGPCAATSPTSSAPAAAKISQGSPSCIEKNEVTYAKWKAHLPLYLVDQNKENLLKLRGIFIDYGQNEEMTNKRTGAQLFSQALAQHNIPHVFEIYVARHADLTRQRMETRVLEFFNERLEFPK